jgi:NUMOD3 motif
MCEHQRHRGVQLSYCVYEHWRPDTDTCFYVGKGKLRRAKSFERRNDRYSKIVDKLKRFGLKPVVRIVHDGLTNDHAMQLEIRLIACRRASGDDLANYTDGGDGCSGRLHSPATREKIARKATGRMHSTETRAKMSVARKGHRWSEETRAKMSASAKLVQGERRRKECAADSAERKRMADMARAVAADPDMRARRAANAKALWQDPEYRARVMAARSKGCCVSISVIAGFS